MALREAGADTKEQQITSSPVDAPQPTTLHRVIRSKTFFGLLICVIIAISFWRGTASRYLNFQNPRIDIVQLQHVDVDYHMLYPSIEAKHTFLDTFQWWREPWRADQWVGAYWRPLTMQAWWIESHIFGEDHSFNWMRVSLLLSVLFDFLLVGFVWTLTKNRWLALLSLAIFALPPDWLHLLSPLTALPRIANADLLIAQGWKDQPDIWANCFSLAALILVLRNKWIWAFVCTLIAIGFKESGLMIFPMVGVLMLANGGLKRIPLWLYPASAIALAAMMYARWLAGPMVFHFHSYGSNTGGPTRYANAVLPLAFSAFTTYGYALFAIGIVALILWRPKNLIIWLVSILTLLAISIASVAWQTQQPLDVSFAGFLMEGWAPIGLLLLWLLLFVVLWTQRKYFWWAMVLAACGYIAALPFAMATQAAEHCLAMGRAMQAGFGACWIFGVAAALYVLAQKRWPNQFKTKQKLATENLAGATE